MGLYYTKGDQQYRLTINGPGVLNTKSIDQGAHEAPNNTNVGQGKERLAIECNGISNENVYQGAKGEVEEMEQCSNYNRRTLPVLLSNWKLTSDIRGSPDLPISVTSSADINPRSESKRESDTYASQYRYGVGSKKTRWAQESKV